MRRCRQCLVMFHPQNSLQVVCSHICAHEYGRSERGRKEAAQAIRRERREWRERNESIPSLTAKAQKAFNRYIRTRDAGLGCISCGARPAQLRGGTMDCGHYRSVGSMPTLRFHPDNAAAQCSRCNEHLSGNVVEFRRGLLARIGPDRLAFIEGPHPPAHWTRDDLRDIRKQFDSLTKSLNLEAIA